jgi:hypothetical protein
VFIRRKGSHADSQSSRGALDADRTSDDVAVAKRMALDLLYDDEYDDSFDGRGLSLAYNRPRVYASSQVFYSLYYH